MTPPTEHSSYSLREVTIADIPVLARHHRLMFEEILGAEHEPVDPERMAGLKKAYAGKLHHEQNIGTCTAWVVEQGDLIVVSGGMSRLSNVPVPEDPRCTVALLHSVYTEPGHRCRGCARMVVRAVLLRCRQEGIHRVQLVVSNAGRSLYEKHGFLAVPNMMRMFLD